MLGLVDLATGLAEDGFRQHLLLSVPFSAMTTRFNSERQSPSRSLSGWREGSCLVVQLA